MEHPFQRFPANHVKAAFRQALEAAQYEPCLDIVEHAWRLCTRWEAFPYLPDCPPIAGRIQGPPEALTRPIGYVPTTEPLTPISDVLARIAAHIKEGEK